MQELSAQGRQTVDDLARRHGFSTGAVETMLNAVANGQGSQAQFSHSEFGGMGQWSRGGMIMIGDMFNNNLKYRVDGLATDLSNVWRDTTLYAPVPSQSQSQSSNGYTQQSSNYSGSSLFERGSSSFSNWWPGDLGSPSSSGAQNDMRYSVFPSSRRLAVQANGQVSVYDTGDHQISGVSQQQGGPSQSVTFSSQYGTFSSMQLPLVSGPGATTSSNFARPSDSGFAPSNAQPVSSSNAQSASSTSHDEIFAKIERLAELRQKGVLSDDEFAAKKTELLSRL